MTKGALSKILNKIKSALDVKVDKNTIADIVDTVPKNYIDTSRLQDWSYAGIKMTVNSDGSLTFSGKASSSGDFLFIGNINANVTGSTGQASTHDLPGPGEYVLDIENNDNHITIQCYATDTPETANTGAGVVQIMTSVNKQIPFVFSLSRDYVSIWFRIVIRAGTEFTDPITIRPMICKKSLYDINPIFQKYQPSSNELKSQVDSIRQHVIQQITNTVEKTSIMITGMNNDQNPTVLLLLRDRRQSSSSAFVGDSALMLCMYHSASYVNPTEIRVNKLFGNVEQVKATIETGASGVVTITGLPTYLTITSISAQPVVVSIV